MAQLPNRLLRIWLWALADHVTRASVLDNTLAAAADLVVRYLLAAGHLPCFDCWEEHPGHVHTASLAAVAAGLRDAGRLLHNERAAQRATELTAALTGPEHTLAGLHSLPRRHPRGRVPAVARRPVRHHRAQRPDFRNTLTRIRDELVVPDGGVHRYLGDTFYGGSEWNLLAAAYGCLSLALDDPRPRQQMHTWIERRRPHGHLPEQVQRSRAITLHARLLA